MRRFRRLMAGCWAGMMGHAAMLLPYCAFCLVFLDGYAARQSDRASRPHPNVLFLIVDDLNDWIGILDGHPQAQTPHMDRLAASGMRFTRAYCSAPLCNPSRASVLMGLRPSTTGVYWNRNPWRKAMPDVVTLPECFKENGYMVAGGGKIYHTRYEEPGAWDRFCDIPYLGGPGPAHVPANGLGLRRQFDWAPLSVDDDRMQDMQIAEWGVDVLQRKHARPFFLAIGIYRPHLPLYAPRKYFEQYPPETISLPLVREDDLDDVPAPGKLLARFPLYGEEGESDHRIITESGRWREAVAAYLANVSFADACVGKLLQALENSEYAENTIVVLWSDHGWHLGEKRHWRKYTLWEEATRVPLIIKVPGLTGPGARCDRVVSLLDLYPTLIELCGLRRMEHLEGRSLAPLLRNPSQDWPYAAVTTAYRNQHAVRTQRWRYIHYQDGSEELYDHRNDPHEFTNLARDPQYGEVKTALRAWLPRVNAVEAPKRHAAGRVDRSRATSQAVACDRKGDALR